MTLQNWLDEGKLKTHTSSPKEIENLFRVIDRDITDAGIEEVSADRRFATAYNAALQLATVALLASGYRVVAGKGHHYITIHSLQHTMGKVGQARMYYLNLCRQARNKTDYDRAGVTKEDDVEQLLEEVTALKTEVIDWLKANHPKLQPITV